MNSTKTADRTANYSSSLQRPPRLHKKQQGCFARFTTIIKQSANVVTSIAVPALISAIPSMFFSLLQDRHLSKIVGGAGFAIGGGYLVCKSGVLRIARSKLFGKRPEEQVPSLTKERAVSAVAGGVMMLYGIQTCLVSIWELVQRKQAQDAELYAEYLQRRSICDETFDMQEKFEFTQKTKNLVTNPQATDKDPKIIENFVSFTRRCPEAVELSKKVEEGGAFRVQLFSESDLPSHAAWNGEDRVLYVNRNAHVLKKIETYIFEQCNAMHSWLFDEIELQVKAGDLSFDEYLEKKISVEFRSMECQHKVASVCVAKKLFPAPIDVYKEQFDENGPQALHTFERFWANYALNPIFKPHRDWYKNIYVLAFRDAFCAKNPKL
jgi:hypothetical protein